MASGIPPRTAGPYTAAGGLSAVPESVALPVEQYIHAEQAAGIMLILGANVGLAWANSPWGDAYEAVGRYRLTALFVTADVRHWVNDGLLHPFSRAEPESRSCSPKRARENRMWETLGRV
jgi:hypothetical protein